MPISRKINQDFFKLWSREMSYALGFFLADGNLVKTKRNTHFISFYTADKKILEDIKKYLKSTHKISKRKYTGGNCYRIQIGSKEIFDDLMHLGVTPNKIRRLKLPLIPTIYKADFIRGYFDGDGNVWAGKNSNQSHVLQAAFTSGSKDFLEDLLILLQERGVRGGSIYAIKNKNCSRLQLSTLDALKLYEIMYNVPHKLYLKRKKLVFEKFIKMRLY